MKDTLLIRIARILEPQAWAAVGIDDTLAHANRRVASQGTAAAVLDLIRADPLEHLSDGMEAPGA